MNHQGVSSLSPLPELTDEQFLLWQRFLEDRTGICVSQQRRQYIKTCLGLRMRELGINDYSAYYQQVINGTSGAIEWNHLIDRITVRETRFFRDKDALSLVRRYIDLQARSGTTDSIDIWSVGCSSGEEAYGLAMIADQVLSDTALTYSVTGTDLSGQALKTALTGQYSKQSIDNLPIEYSRAYMQMGESGRYSVRSEIKDRCCFTQMNLQSAGDYISCKRHIIYCQNVLIYFRKWRRKKIINSLVKQLVPGGLLITGMGEMVDWKHPDMEPVKVAGVNAFIKAGAGIGPDMITGTARR